MKTALIEIKNNLQGNNSRVNETENEINDLEHNEAKNNQSEQQEKKKESKNEDNIRSPWNNFKHTHIRIMGVPEGEEREPVSYTHLTLPTIVEWCRSRWSPYH